MAVVTGFGELGERVYYDVPDAELAKYKVKFKPLTDEVLNRLFPGKDKLTKDDAHGVVPAAFSSRGEVEGYGAMCMYWCWCEDAFCPGYYELPC